MEPAERQPAALPMRHRFLSELLWSWLSNIVALFVAAAIFSGVDYEGNFWILVLAGLVFGLVNAIVRPLVIFLALLSYQPAIVLFAGFVVYAISGYVGSAYLWWKRRRAAEPPAA